jgi:hypothetical protein
MDAVEILIIVLAVAWLGFGIWAWLSTKPPRRDESKLLPRMMASVIMALFLVPLLLAYAINRLF